MLDPPPRAYAKQLLPFGYGYPLWTPESGIQSFGERRDGLQIGDVGVIVPNNGSFDVFFNICLPREHPFHRNGVPDNFVHIDLNDTDIAIRSSAENPGTIISTSSVTLTSKVEPSDGAIHQNTLSYEFSLPSSEGALLVLPEGAESCTLLKKQRFMDAAIQNGDNWYKFVEQQLGRIIPQDSLYLITGCYKSHSWSVAAFYEVSPRQDATEFPARFKAIQPRQGNSCKSYTWETMRPLHWRVGPSGDRSEVPNQAVFINGFKIAIRESIIRQKGGEDEVDALPTRSKPGKFFGGGKGHSRTGNIWRGLVSNSGGNGDNLDRAEPGTIHLTRKGAASNIETGGHGTISHIPEVSQIFHPSDMINRFLLSKDPSAAIAVTHDSQWSTLFEKGILMLEGFDQGSSWESIVAENYRLISRDGVVYLQDPCDFTTRLTGIDDAVREAWEENRLGDADEILSRRIILHIGCNNWAYANRALVRARSRQWDAALRDAEMSIDIQPSVIARVAKGCALFGQQKYTLAVHEFNVALRDCDLRDKLLVSLIRAIILFEAGYHPEGMADISDLVEHSSVGTKPACSTVQAGMYVRLAMLMTDQENYDKALQLLTRVQSLGPFHTVPELDVVSLVCGWKFDDLQFTSHQKKCEVLYVAGRIRESAQSLQTMIRYLDEGVRTKESNSEWISVFTQRCIKSLESLGDSAFASHNYDKAITDYSVAVSASPPAHEGILVKRSNAYAALGSWDDALSDANEAISLNSLSPWGHERKFALLQVMGRHVEAVQAYNDMLSVLERYAKSQIERIDPHLHPLYASTLHRDLDRKTKIESVIAAAKEHDSKRTTSILDKLREERDEIVREKDTPRFLPTDQSDAPGRRLDGINEGTSSIGSNDELGGHIMPSEHRQKLVSQLTDIVRQNKENAMQATVMLSRLSEQHAISGKQDETPTFKLLDELLMYSTKQSELLNTLSDLWKKDSTGNKNKGKQRLVEKDGNADRQHVPYVSQSIREDFGSALPGEVSKIARDVARLAEERRYLKHELGQLMMMRAKYEPGGEFDPGWKPPLWNPPPGSRRRRPKGEAAHSDVHPEWITPAPPSPPVPDWPTFLRAYSRFSPPAASKAPSSKSEDALLHSEHEPATQPGTISTETTSESNAQRVLSGITERPISPRKTIPLEPGNEILLSNASGPSNVNLDRSPLNLVASSVPSPLSFTLPALDPGSEPRNDIHVPDNVAGSSSSKVTKLRDTDMFGGAIADG